MRGEIIIGRLATGIGQGRRFTRLDWARRQFIDRLGIDPFPGTLNVIVEDEASLSAWQRLLATPGVRVENPGNGPHDCDARCYPVMIEGRIAGAIVTPEVAGYPPAQIEIITATPIRKTLVIEDGDLLRLEIE